MLAVMDKTVYMSSPWSYGALCGSISGVRRREASCTVDPGRDGRVAATPFWGKILATIPSEVRINP